MIFAIDIRKIYLAKAMYLALLLAASVGFTGCINTGDSDGAEEAGEENGAVPIGTQNLNSVQAFSATLYPAIQSMNCTTCHNSNHQVNMSVTAAELHSTMFANGLVNLTTPSASRIYLKVRPGHNGNGTAQANRILGEIQAWDDALNPAPSPDPTDTGTNTDTGTDADTDSDTDMDTDTGVDTATATVTQTNTNTDTGTNAGTDTDVEPDPPAPRLASTAVEVMQVYCMNCHTSGQFGATIWGSITNETELIAFAYRDDSRILAGDPNNSGILRRMLHGPGDQSMPPISPKHTPEEYQILHDWIAALAPPPVDQPPPVPTPPPPPPGGGDVAIASTDRVRLGDRRLVKSVLDDVFGPSVNAVTSSMILSRVSKFGGACDSLNSYGHSYPTVIRCNEPGAAGVSRVIDVDVVNYDIDIIPEPFVTREGFRVRTCDEILFKDIAALNFVVERVRGDGGVSTLAANPHMTPTEIQKAYQLFFPGRAPSSEISNKLLAISQRAQSAGLGAVDAPDTRYESWRYVMLALCRSPSWQTE